MTATDEAKVNVYETYYRKVLGYIRGKVNNTTVAEDLCSEVFMKIYEKLETFDESKASLSTWIYTIARNRVTDYFRTRKVFGEIPETLDDGSDVEDDVCSKETLSTLADALERLEQRKRDILILRFYSGIQLKEIAERMGISYTYVKVLQNQAMAEVRAYFGK